jgi:hypothetical protein
MVSENVSKGFTVLNRSIIEFELFQERLEGLVGGRTMVNLSSRPSNSLSSLRFFAAMVAWFAEAKSKIAFFMLVVRMLFYSTKKIHYVASKGIAVTFRSYSLFMLSPREVVSSINYRTLHTNRLKRAILIPTNTISITD